MRAPSPLWPAQLDHLRLDAADPAASVAFYRDVLGMAPRARARGRGLEPLPSPSPVFGAEAFALRDPDGRLIAFGLPRAAPEATPSLRAALPGRLQHVVVASAQLDAMLRFYRDALGFLPSDYVQEGGNRADTACFLRSDPEHHSFAVFRADAARPDHHCYEADCWNDLRDWADHLTRHRVAIWWGPGRHGPGNNLFLMARDPTGHRVEVSAELEILGPDTPARAWPHEERTLNLWGPGWMRS